MKITELKEPLAIAMWDSSWLRRRYAGGGFDDFDRALTELVDRGYNAVRIDVFPHMIANAPDGTNSDRFLDPAGFAFSWYGFAQWGSPWTVYIHPRRDLLAFLKCCEKHGVYVLLSTWLKPTAEPRNEWLEGPEDLVRIWNETLEFLRENNSLGQVIGVDISNEMPNGASNKQFNTQMNSYTDPAEKTAFSAAISVKPFARCGVCGRTFPSPRHIRWNFSGLTGIWNSRSMTSWMSIFGRSSAIL